MNISGLIAALIVSTSVFATSAAAQAASSKDGPRDSGTLFIGYSYFSSGFASANFDNKPLNGLQLSAAGRLRKQLGIKVDVSTYFGSSSASTLSYPQHPVFFMLGPEYNAKLGREKLFLDGLVGLSYVNGDAFGPGGPPSQTIALAYAAGGGVDTPISHRLSIRLEADYIHTSYSGFGSEFHGFPSDFVRGSAGVVINF